MEDIQIEYPKPLNTIQMTYEYINGILHEFYYIKQYVPIDPNNRQNTVAYKHIKKHKQRAKLCIKQPRKNCSR
jgi:hypothetical protein